MKTFLTSLLLCGLISCSKIEDNAGATQVSNGGKIAGTIVMDSGKSSALARTALLNQTITVTLYKQGDSEALRTTAASFQGYFFFGSLAEGIYKIVANSLISEQTVTLENIKVQEDKTTAVRITYKTSSKVEAVKDNALIFTDPYFEDDFFVTNSLGRPLVTYEGNTGYEIQRVDPLYITDTVYFYSIVHSNIDDTLVGFAFWNGKHWNIDKTNTVKDIQIFDQKFLQQFDTLSDDEVALIELATRNLLDALQDPTLSGAGLPLAMTECDAFTRWYIFDPSNENLYKFWPEWALDTARCGRPVWLDQSRFNASWIRVNSYELDQAIAAPDTIQNLDITSLRILGIYTAVSRPSFSKDGKHAFWRCPFSLNGAYVNQDYTYRFEKQDTGWTILTDTPTNTPDLPPLQ